MVARTCETAKVGKEESKGHFTTSNLTCMSSSTLESPLLTCPPCSNHLGFPMALGTEACCCDFFIYFFILFWGKSVYFLLQSPVKGPQAEAYSTDSTKRVDREGQTEFCCNSYILFCVLGLSTTAAQCLGPELNCTDTPDGEQASSFIQQAQITRSCTALLAAQPRQRYNTPFK